MKRDDVGIVPYKWGCASLGFNCFLILKDRNFIFLNFILTLKVTHSTLKVTLSL